METTKPTQTSQKEKLRELDVEIRQLNKFLKEIDLQRQHMNYFVAGLHVAARSILASIDGVKEKYPQDSKQTLAQEEKTGSQPCLRVEEGDKSEAEQVPQEQTEEGEEEDELEESNLSSELIKSLNNTLSDLEQAEEKLMEMNCQDHMAMAPRQPSRDSACYLDFMHEFLANFRQNLLQSCEQFLTMESEELALMHERKALIDLSFHLAKSPMKTANSRDGSTVSAAARTTALRTNKEASIPSATKTSPKTDATKDNNLSNTAAIQKGGDLKDKTSSETKSPVTERDNTEDTPSKDANTTSQKEVSKTTTPSDSKEGVRQSDNESPSSTTTMASPKDVPAASTTNVTPDQKYPTGQILLDDDEFDYVSPLGMTRMFGTMYEEPKIPLSPASPYVFQTDSPTKT